MLVILSRIHDAFPAESIISVVFYASTTCFIDKVVPNTILVIVMIMVTINLSFVVSGGHV